MAHLLITVHWEGEERQFAEARRKVLDKLTKLFPDMTHSGSVGNPGDASYSEERVNKF